MAVEASDLGFGSGTGFDLVGWYKLSVNFGGAGVVTELRECFLRGRGTGVFLGLTFTPETGVLYKKMNMHPSN